MLEFGDMVYYIDLKAFDKSITINNGNKSVVVDTEIKKTFSDSGEILVTETFERSSPQNKEIDAAKYDLLKTFVEYIIDNEEISDDTLGAERALQEASLGYKIVFNTLLQEGIIKEKQ